MDCKQCGSSTTPKQTSRGAAYECNGDNGECLNERGYPTTTWGDTGNGGAPRRQAPQQRRAPQQGARATPSTSTDAQIKWQTCLKVAGAVYQGRELASAKDVIAFARELFAAKPVVAKPAPKPAPVEDEEAPDEEEVF